MLDQLETLRVFCTVGELESFTAASVRLEISKSSATRHIQQLEQRLGVRLLHRTSRRISLTEVGRAYWESVKAILEDLDEADLSVSQEAKVPAGRLRLTAPSWFGLPRFVGILAELRASHPQLELDIELSDQQVDLLEEGLDVALRVTAELKTSLLAHLLCPMRFRLVASPRLMPRLLHYPESLEGYPWLEYRYSKLEGRLQFGPQQVALQTVLRSNSTTMLHQAARSGVGLAVLPEWLVEEDLASGALVEVFAEHPRPNANLYALCSTRRYLSARVQVLLDRLAHRLSEE